MRMAMATTRILMGALAALSGSAALATTSVVTADRLLDVLAGRMVDKPAVVVVDGRITPCWRRARPRSPPTRPASTCPARPCCPG